MIKSKSKLIVAAISALMAELVYPAFIPTVAQASSLPQFDIVSVRFDRTMASNSLATPSATVMYTGGTVCIATPASGTFSTIPNAGAETDVEIGFPAEQGAVSGPNVISSLNDFHVKSTLANWITNTTDPGSGNAGQNYFPLLDGLGTETAWPSIGTPALATSDFAYSSGDVASKRIVRFSSGNLAAGHDYCFNFKDGSGTTGAETSGTASLQLPDQGTNGYQENVPGFVTTYKCSSGCSVLGAGTPIMSSNWGVQITSASTVACSTAPCNDYYTVNAVVPPLLIFKLDHNADTFLTNLDPNQSVATGGVTATVQTNAKGGWIMWAKDTNQGLSSAASGGHIPTPAWTGTPTTIYTSPTQPANAFYGLVAAATSNVGGVTSCGAANTPAGAQVEPEYAGSIASPVAVGTFEADWAEIADCSASTAGTDGGSTVNLKEAATITFSTPASTDYTDTVYVAAAGEF